MQRSSDGADNPAVGAVFDQWRAAEHTGIVPSDAESSAWAAAIHGVPYEFEGDEVVCV